MPTIEELRAKVTAENARYVDVPAGTPEAQCRSCETVVYWITTRTNARAQVDCCVAGGKRPTLDEAGKGVLHFATCPQGKMWSKRK